MKKKIALSGGRTFIQQTLFLFFEIRYTALCLWAIYNIVTVIVLLNILIALMNATMESIVDNKVASWKYHRTQVRDKEGEIAEDVCSQ